LLKLSSFAWAKINTVSLATGLVFNDKDLQYFNIYGHKCCNLHSFTLHCNSVDCHYSIKQGPNEIHVQFTQHAAYDIGPKKDMPRGQLQCYQHLNLLALAKSLLTVTPIEQALWVVALHVTLPIHEHLPATDGCRAVAPRTDTQ
jgi:hypothetical protein